jgi:hypothetical protein
VSAALDIICFTGVVALLYAGLRHASADTPATIFLGGCFLLLLLCFVLTWGGKGRK